MTVDVYDRKSGKFIGTKYHVNYIQEGQMYYFLRDEENEESRYNKSFHKLVIHSE